MFQSEKAETMQAKKAASGETIDILLFLTLGIITALFTISGLPQSTFFTSDYPFGDFTFDKLSSLLLILGTLIYVFLYFLFVSRRYRKTGIMISRWLIIFLIVISIFRAISDFSFPYGNISWNVISPFDSLSYTLLYEGYSLSERFISFITEVAYMSYFLLPFTYIKTFDRKKFHFLIDFTLWFLIVLGLVMNVYSWIKEGNDILWDIKYLLGMEKGEFIFIKSFTTHKNHYGFFMWMSALASLLLYMENPRKAWLQMIFLVNDLAVLTIIKSRIPFVLTSLILLFILAMMASVHSKKHKGNAIFAYVVLSLGILSLLALVIFFRDSSIFGKIKNLFSSFSDMETMHTRNALQLRALCLLNTPQYWLFGLGKGPYYQLFELTGITFEMEIVYFSHNAFLDQILCYGIIGLILISVPYLILVYECLYLIRKRKPIGLCHLFIIVSFIIYGFGESRMLFGIDGNEFFFMLTLLFPLSYEYEKTKDSHDTINHRILTKGL